MDILTIIESGGTVALAVVVWFELHGMRNDLRDVLKSIDTHQQHIAETQLIIMDRYERCAQVCRADEAGQGTRTRAGSVLDRRG